ncbi:tyrosine-type recombinase/integrase [Cryptosporangium sp. NPDC051539]|uniref:tyrosine-type recombinase/integrase n=1 Tax=Cryptosporangium sp. NPDC051539 TaxID=3363962 RepID=UPI00379C3FAB
MRLHDLRHGAATIAHAAGADLKTIQDQLGHASIALTADTYTTVLPDAQFAAADATAEVLLGANPRTNDRNRLRCRPDVRSRATSSTRSRRRTGSESRVERRQR